MNALPKITVITPSFNQVKFIEQTIESVLNQGYPNLEYIIMDGGSTDGTIEVLKRYSGWLEWISERDRGQSHAINKGLRMATGDVLAFINSDDLYEPGALLKVGTFFAEHSEAAWLTGKCRIIDQEGQEIRRLITKYKNFWLRLKSYQLLLIIDYISQPATFWRKRVIEKVGFFDETLHYAMDYDYSLRVGRLFKLWVLDDYLASYRIHPSSKAGSSAHAQFETDLEIARRYVSSPAYGHLHALHNALIVTVYRRLLSQNRGLKPSFGQLERATE